MFRGDCVVDTKVQKGDGLCKVKQLDGNGPAQPVVPQVEYGEAARKQGGGDAYANKRVEIGYETT